MYYLLNPYFVGYVLYLPVSLQQWERSTIITQFYKQQNYAEI